MDIEDLMRSVFEGAMADDDGGQDADTSLSLPLSPEDEEDGFRFTGFEPLIEVLLARAVSELKFKWQAPYDFQIEDCYVERPADPRNGDFASTLPLKLAGKLHQNPRQLAQDILDCVQSILAEAEGMATLFDRIEVAGAGFINFKLSPLALHLVLAEILNQGDDYAAGFVDGAQYANVEYVSANPTGPMHLGHARWAALGNAICNILEFCGFEVTREFYINDAGHQMDVFGASIAYRYRELCGQDVGEPPVEFYGGAYVRDIASQIKDLDGERWLETDAQDFEVYAREFGYKLMLSQMQDFLSGIGIEFDVWASERDLYVKDEEGNSAIDRMLAELREKGLLYEQDGATWFSSTRFGDDKDRVLVKSDGSYTYFTPDIAYHLQKFMQLSGRVAADVEAELAEAAQDGDLDFVEYLQSLADDNGEIDPHLSIGVSLVDIWGADHHGYVPRMRAAMQALELPEGTPKVLLGQLVNLFRDGVEVKMSKRSGEMVTFEELVEEVGADATLFLLLEKEPNQTIDFDIELAKKQDSSNPVYYVQYAHARICSLFRKAEESDFVFGLQPDVFTAEDFSLLTDPLELKLLHELERYAEVLHGAVAELAPHHLVHYLEDLAAAFHKFYTGLPILTAEPSLANQRLDLAEATEVILESGLDLLGISAPEAM